MPYSPIVQHSFLGTLYFDPQMVWYAGTFVQEDQLPIDFNIGVKDLSGSTDVDLLLNQQLQHIQNLFEKKFHHEVINHMIEVLLPIKNSEWLDANETAIDHAEFLERIELKGILVYEDGSAEFNVADDGIFWGHDIIIYTDQMGAFEDTHLAE